MKEIPLTKGLTALVDDEDYERLSAYRWFGERSKNGRTGYAVTKSGYGRKGTKSIRMHQILMGDGEPGLEIDHKNRNGLDNRRSNLRWATKAQQRANQPVRVDSKTGFKGVNLLHGKYWAAHIAAEGRQLHLGYFPSSEDAARAYDAKARELFGEFACLNFPSAPHEGNPMTYFDSDISAAPVAERNTDPILPEERFVLELVGFERSEPDQYRKNGGIRWTFRVSYPDGSPFIFQDNQYEVWRQSGINARGEPIFNLGTQANEWASALLGRQLGVDADFKISELRGKKMSAMIVWRAKKTNAAEKTYDLASLRHVPTGASSAPKRDVTTVSDDPTGDDVDRALAVTGLKKSIATLKKLDAESAAAAQHAYDASDLDTAPVSEIRELWDSVKAAIAKAMED